MERNQKSNNESSGLLIEINSEGFCVRTNKAIYAETGYLPQEIIGKKFKSFLEIDSNYLREIEQRISLSTESVVYFDCYFKNKLGASIYMQWAMYWSENQNHVICIGKVFGQNETILSQENQHLQLLNAIHENIQLHRNENDLLNEVCKIIIRVGHYPLAWVGQIENEQIKLICKDSEVFISDSIFEKSFLGSGLLQNTLHQEQLNGVLDLNLSEQQEKEIFQSLQLPIKNVLIVSLPDRPNQFVAVASLNTHKFDQNTKSTFEKLGTRLSFALRSFQNEDLLMSSENNLKKHIRELNLLNEVNNKILLIKEETKLIKEVLKTLNEQGNYKLSWIAFFEAEQERKQIIIPAFSHGSDEYANSLRFDLNNPEILKGPAATCILTRKTAIVSSSSDDTNFSFWRENALKHQLNSVASLYLNISPKNKAVLSVYSPNNDAFDYREIIILERIAHSLSYAIHAIRTFKESSQFKNELNESQKKLIDYEIALNETSIVSITDKDGAINYVNKKFEETYGIKASQMIGSKHSLVNSKHHNSAFWEELWQTINAGKTWTGNIKNIDISGKEKWFETIIYPFLNVEGVPYQFIGMQRDISESIALQEKVNLVNRLVDSAEVPIYSIGIDDEVISWNQGATQLFGFSEPEVVGKKYSSFLSEDQIDEMHIIWAKIKKGDSISAIEVERSTKDNKSIFLSLSISPLRNLKHEIIGAAFIAKDITRTKQAELMAFSLNTKLITREREFEFLSELSQLNNIKNKGIATYLNDFLALMQQHWSSHLLSNVKVNYKNKTFVGKNFIPQETFSSSQIEHENQHPVSIEIHHPASYHLSKSEKYLLNLSCAWLGSSLKYKEYSYKLSERIKELNTQQYLVKLADECADNLDVLFEKLAAYLPQHWQFPQMVIGQITYHNKTYWSEPNSAAEGPMQIAEFETIEKIKGSLSIQYKNEKVDHEEEIFLEAEQNLLHEISDSLRNLINQQILQKNLKSAENKIQKIVNYVDAAVVLMQANGNILFSNVQSNDMMKEVFQLNLAVNQNVLDQLSDKKHHELLEAMKGLGAVPESQYLFEVRTETDKIKSYELKLQNLDLHHFASSDKLLVLKEITHIKDREEEINNLINLLKDLNFITSFEISHELHKLQSIVELAQDLDFVDADLREIFSTSKETFAKTNSSLKKLINRINIPLQKEISIANSLKRIEKVFLIDDDELSNKISLRILEKHFDPMKLICYSNLDEAISYFKSDADSGNHIILIEPNMKAKSAWDFFEFYANKNMSSPVILIGSNPDALSIQKAMTYTCVKNYIQKPLNNAMAKRINSKDAFIWNNQ